MIKDYSNYKPKIYPIGGKGSPANIDRAQSIDTDDSLEREARYEIGRQGVGEYIKSPSDIGWDATISEYGNFEFWKKVANVADDVKTIDVNDFGDSWFDIAGVIEGDSGYEGTKYFPNLRVESFSLDLSDPDAVIERNFTFTGEKDIRFENDNKFLIYKEHTAGSGSDNAVDLSGKVPTEDPDLERYMLRIVRIRTAADDYTLNTDDYTYSDTGSELTIDVDEVETDDLFKIWYTSSDAPDTIFEKNDTDSFGITADSVNMYMYIPASGHPNTDDFLYRVQNCTLDASLDREDVSEIGNDEIVQRSVTGTTISIDLGELYEDIDIARVLRGVDNTYGRIDIDRLANDIKFVIKIYDTKDKNNFRYGMVADRLSPTSSSDSISVEDNISRDWSLEGTNLTITEDPTELPI